MYALIKNGKVENVIEADTAFAEAIASEWDAVVHVADGVGPGHTYINGVFTAPEAVVIATPSKTLTHLQFRRLFTQTERELADELEATFETNSLLTVDQKRTLRSGYKDFNAASEVDLDDPGIPPMLYLYTALGILAPGRSVEILAGQ